MHESQESTGLSSEFLSANNETPLVRSKVIPSFWHDHFKGWEKSGLSQATYCRRNDLKNCLFHYWKRKRSKPSQPSVHSDWIPYIYVYQI